MTACLLFCLSEKARPLVRKTLNYKDIPRLLLVESHDCPATRDGFKTSLGEKDDFVSDWIGASKEECQHWALEKQYQVNFMEQDILAIADERGAEDDTILMLYHSRDLEPVEFPNYGILPRKRNTWYPFRVSYKEARQIVTMINSITPDVSYPICFGLKDKFTDEHGVFHLDKAQKEVLDQES